MVPTYLAKGYTMNRELEIAVERAARAAVVDPLVEALEALQECEETLRWLGNDARIEDAWNRARAILAKYAPDRAGGGE